MGQGSSDQFAVVQDAQIMFRKEEYVEDTGQSLSYAAGKGAQIDPSKEECA